MYRRRGSTKRFYTRRRYYKSGDTLTGGTKDVNPQWFRGYVTCTKNTTAESNFQLPITRIPTANKVTILELLKVQVIPKTTPFVVDEALARINYSFATASLGTTAQVNLDDGRVICQLGRECSQDTDGGGFQVPTVLEMDLTDGSGHGMLIASDKLYVQTTQNNLGAASSVAAFGLLYRFKTVGMREYVGIVQSQQ